MLIMYQRDASGLSDQGSQTKHSEPYGENPTPQLCMTASRSTSSDGINDQGLDPTSWAYDWTQSSGIQQLSSHSFMFSRLGY